MHTPGVIWTTLAMSSFSSVLEGTEERQREDTERLMQKAPFSTEAVECRSWCCSRLVKGRLCFECQLATGTVDLNSTHHFAHSVLQRGDHGAEPLQLHKHVCQLITGEATDCLDVLGLMADVIRADSWAGAIDGVVQCDGGTGG